MKVYITGITGTVAPYVKEEFQANGFDVFDKHFRINEETDIKELKDYIHQIKPDIIVHLALGPFSVVETLAEYAKANHIKFAYISTVSVYEDNAGGPYNKDTIVTVENEYGKYKYDCENIVRKIKPDSYIIRIGWQISDQGDSESNNMFNFIKNNTDDNNTITVSDQFFPSTSFLDETAKAIVNIITTKEPDLYLANSNKDKSLYDIVSMLKEQFHLDIEVVNDSTFSRNDIMIDNRVNIRKL